VAFVHQATHCPSTSPISLLGVAGPQRQKSKSRQGPITPSSIKCTLTIKAVNDRRLTKGLLALGLRNRLGTECIARRQARPGETHRRIANIIPALRTSFTITSINLVWQRGVRIRLVNESEVLSNNFAGGGQCKDREGFGYHRLSVCLPVYLSVNKELFVVGSKIS
jgi:hypothetical protein